MASALLGTVALLPVDRTLARESVPYERWVDDVTVAARSELEFNDTEALVQRVLTSNGQTLNHSKRWFEAAPAHDHVAPSQLEWGQDAATSVDSSVDALRRAVARGDAGHCRYLLGALRGRRDTAAVPLVVTESRVWRMGPRYAADYLIECRDALTYEQLEEMGDRCATALASEDSAAEIAHRARVLARRRVPATLGSQLHDSAERISTGPFRAAAPFLYHASSVSHEKPTKRCHRSIETASAVRDLLSARGLIAGLKFDTRPRSVDKGLSALAACRPDLMPTVAWIRA
jgi:hypothetical protein